MALQDNVGVVVGACIFIALWFTFMLGLDSVKTGLETAHPTAMGDPGILALWGSWWVLPTIFLIAVLFYSLVINQSRKRRRSIF